MTAKERLREERVVSNAAFCVVSVFSIDTLSEKARKLLH